MHLWLCNINLRKKELKNLQFRTRIFRVIRKQNRDDNFSEYRIECWGRWQTYLQLMKCLPLSRKIGCNDESKYIAYCKKVKDYFLKVDNYILNILNLRFIQNSKKLKTLQIFINIFIYRDMQMRIFYNKNFFFCFSIITCFVSGFFNDR